MLNPRETLAGLKVSHLDEYFGVWAIREDILRAALLRIEGIDLRAHVVMQQARLPQAFDDGQEMQAAARGDDYPIVGDGVAIIEVSGPLMKYASSLSGGTSTVATRRQIRAAGKDERVKAVAFRFDTPGGTVSGTQDLADDIAMLGTKKPTLGYAEDLCCSAGYWGMSQCNFLVCNPTAIVGSIGTYAVLADYSEYAKNEGIKIHVIKAGEFKGAGIEGTKVTEAQLEEMQRLVSTLNSHFLAGVASGRKMTKSQVKELADGRVHVGAEAKALGLVDSVESFDDAVARLAKSVTSPKPAGSRADNLPSIKGIEAMPPEAPKSETPVALPVGTAPATFDELKSTFPKASNDFLVEQLGRKATIAQARDAYTASLEAHATKLQTDNDQLKAQQNKSGVEGITDRPASSATVETETGGGAIAAWEALVDSKMKIAGNDRSKALRMANRDNPELRQAYLEAYNTANADKRKPIKGGK